MGNLIIFKQRFVNALLKDASDNIPKYSRDEPWAHEIGLPTERDLPTALRLNSSLGLKLPTGSETFDLENAIAVHKALPRLTRLQARDPRLWTRLTHIECWKYMRARWAIEKPDDEIGDEGKTKTAHNKVVSRYFVTQNQSRSLMRNGVARLWWIAECTFDEARENPYELTAILLATLDITQTVMERAFGRSCSITASFLDFVKDNRDVLIDMGNVSRHRVRALAKFINLQGGVCMLDALSPADLKKMLQAELGAILQSEQKETTVE